MHENAHHVVDAFVEIGLLIGMLALGILGVHLDMTAVARIAVPQLVHIVTLALQGSLSIIKR